MIPFVRFVRLSGIVGFTLGMSASTPGQGAPPSRLHSQLDSLPWMTTARYPDWFRKTYRYKELVGWVSDWQSAKASAWKGVPNPEIRMGFLELDPGATYPFHAHPAPELYYVMHGTARWTVGNETFVARPGTAVNTPPNTRHSMINIGPDTLELLYVWWAPGGNRSVLDTPSKMLEGWDHPPRPAKRP
jgi:quercetin dioxygenase-like cupin family protein